MQLSRAMLVILIIFFILFAASSAAALDADSPEALWWIELLGSEPGDILKRFGRDFVDIPPSQLQSRADRVLWYETGLTFWFSDDHLVQLRLDSAAEGEISGLRPGLSVRMVKKLCGRPWIELPDSLYYNLPWHGGPVRLRFEFNSDGLGEIYLFYVR